MGEDDAWHDQARERFDRIDRQLDEVDRLPETRAAKPRVLVAKLDALALQLPLEKVWH